MESLATATQQLNGVVYRVIRLMTDYGIPPFAKFLGTCVLTGAALLIPVVLGYRIRNIYQHWRRCYEFEAQMRLKRAREAQTINRHLNDDGEYMQDDELVDNRPGDADTEKLVPRNQVGRFIKKVVRELRVELGQLPHTPGNVRVVSLAAAKVMTRYNLRKCYVGEYMTRASAWYFVSSDQDLVNEQTHLMPEMIPRIMQQRGLRSKLWDQLFGSPSVPRFEAAE